MTQRIDLSRIDPPEVVESLDFEAIYQEMMDEFRRLYPDWTAALESDPVVKLLEVAAYREMLVRARINDAARAVMQAIEQVTANPALHTRDLGGTATTAQVTDAVCALIGSAPLQKAA